MNVEVQLLKACGCFVAWIQSITPSLWLGTDPLPLQKDPEGLDSADLIITIVIRSSYMRREGDARLWCLLRLETRS